MHVGLGSSTQRQDIWSSQSSLLIRVLELEGILGPVCWFYWECRSSMSDTGHFSPFSLPRDSWIKRSSHCSSVWHMLCSAELLQRQRPDTPAHEPCGSCKQGLYLRFFRSLQMQEMLMVTYDWLISNAWGTEWGCERRYRWPRKRGEAWLFPESLSYLQQITTLSIAQHLGEYGSVCLIEPLLG